MVFVFGLVFGTPSPVSIVNSLISGISLIGLWGYMSQKAIGPNIVWVVMFAFQILGTALSVMANLAAGLPLGFVLPLLVLVSPLIIGLYRYAFRSPEVWASDTVGA